MGQQRLDEFEVRFDLLQEFRLLQEFGDAAAANEFALHHLLRLMREQFVDGIDPVGDGELRGPESGGAIGRGAPAAASAALARAFAGLEQEADELLDAFGVGVAAARDAVPLGDFAEHQPPARECVGIHVSSKFQVPTSKFKTAGFSTWNLELGT